MRIYRICSRRYRALDGEGARIHGGRWSFPGIGVVYASESLSLAALELLTHVDADLVPGDLVWVGIEVPGKMKIDEVRLEDLPAGWQRYPAPVRLQEIGSAWRSRPGVRSCRCPRRSSPRSAITSFFPGIRTFAN
jgi:RES domain-containing protein